MVCGLPFICHTIPHDSPFFFRKFSVVRLYVQHAKNTHMLEAKFGPIVTRKLTILSDATHLKFLYYLLNRQPMFTGAVLLAEETLLVRRGQSVFQLPHQPFMIDASQGKWELDISEKSQGTQNKLRGASELNSVIRRRLFPKVL